MKIVNGNIIHMAQQNKFDVIVHGCNCQNVMGLGVANLIKIYYPAAWDIDVEVSKKNKPKDKLGRISWVIIGNLTVVNAYTQLNYGRYHKQVDYKAIRSCFKSIAEKCNPKHRIGYPAIGAGLGGGDWDVIKEIIDEELEGLDHTVVFFD